MQIVGVGAVLVAVAFIAPVSAQQSDQPVSERLELAIQKRQYFKLLIPPDPPWIDPKLTKLGILTIAPPSTNGGMVNVIVPVGELATRAAHAISSAQDRRAQRKARDEVQGALKDFLQARAPAQ